VLLRRPIIVTARPAKVMRRAIFCMGFL
jgi:hypothetical protein